MTIQLIKLLLISTLIALTYSYVHAAELSNDPLPTVRKTSQHIKRFSSMSANRGNGSKGTLKERSHCRSARLKRNWMQPR